MKKVILIVGGVILLLLVILIATMPGYYSEHLDRVEAEQGHLLNAYSEIWNRRAASESQLSVTQVVEQITKEGGGDRLKCPVHGVPYVLNTNWSLWEAANRSDEIAMFCRQPHYGRIIIVKFGGRVGRLKSPPDWSRK